MVTVFYISRKHCHDRHTSSRSVACGEKIFLFLWCHFTKVFILTAAPHPHFAGIRITLNRCVPILLVFCFRIRFRLNQYRMIFVISELNHSSAMSTLICISNVVFIVKSACIDIQFHRKYIRLDFKIKAELFNQLSCSTVQYFQYQTFCTNAPAGGENHLQAPGKEQCLV